MRKLLVTEKKMHLSRYRLVAFLGAVAAGFACLAGCPQEPAAPIASNPVEQSENRQLEPLTTAPAVKTDSLQGKVIAVQDGDTIDLLDSEHQKTRIRFHGIDAPENGQPFGRNAKQYVSDRIGGQMIEVICRDVDRYDRTIGDIILDGKRLNVELVRAGLAWHYVQYAPDDQELAEAEKAAREAKIGLWSDGRHVAPWEWRKLSKVERDKLR